MSNSSNSNISNLSNNNSNNTNNNNNNNHHHNRINNGTQACAACKYQRRKCAPDCALAPYFPHDRQRQFLNAHKLFGVSNITKIIRNLSPPEKEIAMRTIIYQSDARAKDPVGGCYRIIRDLHHQIEYCKAELDLVLQQLALCKAQAYQQSQLLQMTNNCNNGEVIQATISSCNSNNNEQATQIVANDQDYQALMRCYYENDDQGNYQEQEYVPVVHEVVQNHHDHNNNNEETNSDTFTWTNIHEDMSGNQIQAGECYNMIRRDFCREVDGGGGDQCGLLEVKSQMQIHDHGGVTIVDGYDDERDYGSCCKFDNHAQVDVSCCDLQREGLKFDPQQTTELSEEVILKEGKVILEDQEDESFHHHHIAEHDLRSAATLFTLTN